MAYDRRDGDRNIGYHGNHNGIRPDAGAKKPGGAWAGTEQRNGPAERPFGRDPKRKYAVAPRAVRIDNAEEESDALDSAQADNLLVGRNPIREALKSGKPVEKLLVMRGDLSGSAREIVRMARDAGAVVQEVDKARLDQTYPNHQGLIAYVAAWEYSTVDEIIACAQERGEAPFLVLLDGVTDPHNLGAIIRSAECAGAHGIIIPERRSAGLNPACVKAAAGALSYIKVAKVTNLVRTAEALKEMGVWLYAADMEGDNVYETDLSGPIALVIGSEGEGVSQLMRKTCDHAVRIPMSGHIGSLNASVAAGILLFETARDRRERATRL